MDNSCRKSSNGSLSLAGLEAFTETRFPQRVRRGRLFCAGQATAARQAAGAFAYDGFGNVTQYADLADVGADVFPAIHYSGGPGGKAPSRLISPHVGVSPHHLRHNQVVLGSRPGRLTSGIIFILFFQAFDNFS